jgi:uncharacterized protein (TIGR02246 family)
MMKVLALALALVLSISSAEAQPVIDTGIQKLVGELVSAWNSGDAAAFAKRFRADGTFTNVNGTTLEGRAAFEQRHRDILAGPLKGSVTTMTARRAQLLRPDVALVDVDCSTTVGASPPIQSKLLLVLA